MILRQPVFRASMTANLQCFHEGLSSMLSWRPVFLWCHDSLVSVFRWCPITYASLTACLLCFLIACLCFHDGLSCDSVTAFLPRFRHGLSSRLLWDLSSMLPLLPVFYDSMKTCLVWFLYGLSFCASTTACPSTFPCRPFFCAVMAVFSSMLPWCLQ
jgi:hypothetical protein